VIANQKNRAYAESAVYDSSQKSHEGMPGLHFGIAEGCGKPGYAQRALLSNEFRPLQSIWRAKVRPPYSASGGSTALFGGRSGVDELPCEVWEINAEEAKVRGLQLNYLRGQPVPRRLAELVHELHRTYAVDDLAKMLPWSASQLRDSLELLKLPADLRETLDRQAQQNAAEAPVPVTVVLLGKEHEHFERAMAAAKSELGKGARKGQCLERICLTYLDRNGRPQEADAT